MIKMTNVPPILQMDDDKQPKLKATLTKWYVCLKEIIEKMMSSVVQWQSVHGAVTMDNTGNTKVSAIDGTQLKHYPSGRLTETTIESALDDLYFANEQAHHGMMLDTYITLSKALTAANLRTLQGIIAPTVHTFLQTAYYTFTCSSSVAFSAGAIYSNNSSQFKVVYASTLSGQSVCVAYRSSGTNAPSASGTLTYVSGGGANTSNITYTAVATNGTY